MISMSWFMDLIASQINFIYMPLLRVNAPGQVSFYLEILIFVCTFDPIPLDILYELMPFWNFDYVGVENDREAFPRIGLEDRNMVGVLGSMIFFMMVYVITQVIWHILRLFEDKHRYIPYLLSFIKKETLYRTIIVIFLLEAYLDLLLGGLLNTENDYLFEDPANWGINGELTTSDQFSILLGNVIYIATQLFPYAVMFLLQ